MPRPAPAAVFLSYASQDAEAARRICEALRAVGVEVWFDQSELVGGDAWDAKIRGQIKECALFVPIVSAATEARGEGYFRLEWKLAADRSHLMARDRAFLLPVAIDDTPAPTARVPEEFHAVQWTRMPGGEVPAGFAGHVVELLAGRRGATPRLRADVGGDRRVLRRTGTMIAIAAGAGTLAVAAVAFWPRTAPPRPDAAPAAAASVAAPAAAAAPAPLSTQNPEVRQAILRGRELLEHYVTDDTMRERLTLAEELAKKALQLDVTDADAWSLSAQVSSAFVTTGRDPLPARRAAMNSAAEKAMQLAPQSDEARFARGVAYRLEASMRVEAERILRELAERAPTDRRILRMHGNALRNLSRPAEALAAYQRAAAVPGGDARAELYGAEVLVALGRRAEALAAVDRSLKVQATGSAQLFKINLAREAGDLAAARAELAKLPPAVLLDDRGAVVAALVWLWSREPDRMIEVLKAIPGDDINNALFVGPKSLLLGFAHQQAGRDEAAKAQWRIALKNLEQRAAADPVMTMMDPRYLGAKMFLGCLTGDPEKWAEATQLLRLYVQVGGTGQADSVWDPVKIFTLIGKQDILIDFCEVVLKSGEMPNLREELRTKPLYAPLRGNPRFDALLKEPEARK